MDPSSYCCYERRLPYRTRFKTQANSEPYAANLSVPSSTSSSPSSAVSTDHDQPPVTAVVYFFLNLTHHFVTVEENGKEIIYDGKVRLNSRTTLLDFSLFKCYDRAFSKLSQCLSSMGIHSDQHDEILREAICHYGKMRTKTISTTFPRRGMISICFYLEGSLLSFSHEQCLIAKTHQSDQMVAACEKAVEEQVKRVDVMGFDGEACSICLEGFAMEEGCGEVRAAAMPCSHVFHEHCILHWLKKSQYCPLCRFKIQFELQIRLYLAMSRFDILIR